MKAARAAGHKITPCPKKFETCSLVDNMWLSVDHARVADKQQPEDGAAPRRQAATQSRTVPQAIALDSEDEVPAPTANASASAAARGPTADEVEEAMLVLIRHYKRAGQDSFLRRPYQDAAQRGREKKEGATDCAIEEAESKRRKKEREDDRLAANEKEERKERVAQAQEAAATRRLQALQLAEITRRDISAYNRWLQTKYPVELATRLIDKIQSMSVNRKGIIDKWMQTALDRKIFKRFLSIPDLWAPDTSCTEQWAQTKEPFGPGNLHWVRCGPEFLTSVIQRCAPNPIGAVHDPPRTLLKVFQACLPHAQKALRQNEAYTPIRILHMNDYVMEKAFVWGIIAFSKWMTVHNFPLGVFDWPPARPGRNRLATVDT